MTSSTDDEPLAGVQRPRVESIPDYVSSAGEEAVEFCDSIGLHLDPWQRHVITHALGERRDGRYAAFEVGLIVPRQNGKGDLGLDTPVLTTAGWSTMGALRVGDYVYGADGKPTRVTACSPVFTDHACYRVSFTDGASYVAGAGHLWHVRDKDARGWRNVTTEHLFTRFGRRRSGNGRMEYRYRVRCNAVPDTPAVELPIDPYLLGIWLGDGSSRAATITVGWEDRDWVVERLKEAGAEVIRQSTHDHGHALGLHFRIDAKMRDGFESRCRRLGVWGDKHIPEVYLTAAPEQRRQLLAGLMDSDGSIAVTNRSPQAEFATSLPRLAADFQRLVRSLGVRVAPREGATTHKPRHRFLWTPTFNPFEMPRKASRWQPPATRRYELMSVTGVERVPTVPTRCIQVDRPDGVYLVGHAFTPTHNSVLEARELAGLFLLDEQLILHSAHEFKTAQEGFRRTLAHVQNNRELEKRVARVRTSHGEEGIELKSGARLRFVARSTGSGRGFSGDCVILDEAYNLASEGMSALLPTLSARPNPQIWYTSSAGMTTSDQLRKVRERGIAGESKRLAYFEWSAPSEVDLDDRKAWAQANPALGIRITEEFIESERDAMDDLGFSRERLGLWFDPAAQMVIDGKKWRELADPSSKISGPVVFAVDATPERSGAAIAVAGRREDGLGHVEVIDARSGTGWVVRRLVDLVARHRPRAVILERASAAGSWIPALQDAGIDPVLAGARDMAQACGALYEDVTENAALRHLDQHPLNAALIGARKRTLADSWAWHRRDSSVDISPLVAVTLAWHGLAQHGAPARRSAYEDDDLVVV